MFISGTEIDNFKLSGSQVDRIYLGDDEVWIKPIPVDSTDPFGDGSLISKYEMEDNVLDTTDTHDGTATSLTYATGKFGEAAVFDGNAKVDTNVPFDLTTGFSLSCFASLDNNAKTVFSIVTGDSGNDTNVWVYLDNSELQFKMLTGGSNNSWQTLIAVDISEHFGTFTHFVFTIDADRKTASLTVDGVKHTGVASEALLSQIDNKPIYLGVLWSPDSGDDHDLIGSLDQVEIYNRVLTDSEVSRLYAQR